MNFKNILNYTSFTSNRSSKWKKIRGEHLEKEKTCQCCNSIKNLQVHHIDPVHNNPEKELDFNNLVTLCASCHFVFGHLMDYKSWNPAVIDDIKVYNNKIINRPYNIKMAVQNYEKFTLYGIIMYYINLWISWYNRS